GVGWDLIVSRSLDWQEGPAALVDDCGWHATFGRLGDELLLLGTQDARLLLADGIAERVRLRPGEAAERDRRGHDVLLVDEDPVGPLEERLEQRVEVRDRLLAVLAPDVGRDVV